MKWIYDPNMEWIWLPRGKRKMSILWMWTMCLHLIPWICCGQRIALMYKLTTAFHHIYLTFSNSAIISYNHSQLETTLTHVPFWHGSTSDVTMQWLTLNVDQALNPQITHSLPLMVDLQGAFCQKWTPIWWYRTMFSLSMKNYFVPITKTHYVFSLHLI